MAPHLRDEIRNAVREMFLEYLDKINYLVHQECNLSLLVVPQLIVIAHRRRPRQLVLYPSRSFIGSVKMNGEMVLILLGKSEKEQFHGSCSKEIEKCRHLNKNRTPVRELFITA